MQKSRLLPKLDSALANPLPECGPKNKIHSVTAYTHCEYHWLLTLQDPAEQQVGPEYPLPPH
jgi:hypothetical protein